MNTSSVASLSWTDYYKYINNEREKNMAQNNSWQIEGFLGKKEYVKEGQGKNGPWMIQKLSVYAGKDKETGKTKYEYISFFVPQAEIETFRNFPDGTILRLTGKPTANAYIDKEGNLQKSVQMQLAWENSFEVVEKQAQEPSLPGIETYSDAPF